MADNNSHWTSDMIRGLEKAQAESGQRLDKSRLPDLTYSADETPGPLKTALEAKVDDLSRSLEAAQKKNVWDKDRFPDLADNPPSDDHILACPFPSTPFYLEVLSKAVSATVPLNEPLLAKLWTGSTSKRGQWWVDVWFLDENEKGWTARLLLDPAADGTLYRIRDMLPALESRVNDLTREIETLTAKQGQPSEHINIYGDLRTIRAELDVLQDNSRWPSFIIKARLLAVIERLDRILLKE